MNLRDSMIITLTATCLCLLSCEPSGNEASSSNQPEEQPRSAPTSAVPSSGGNGTDAPVDPAPMTPEQIAAEEINRAGEAAEAEAMRIAAEGLPPNAIDDSGDKPKAASRE